MAFTKLLVVTTLVAVACADYYWPFNQGQMPGFNAFPNFGFPQLNLPMPPPLPTFNFQSFPQVPQFDITKVTPGPGQIYSGIAVQSSSSLQRDKDGNLIKNGGSSLLTNDNGVVHRYDVGDSPPYTGGAKIFSTQFGDANSAQMLGSGVSMSTVSQSLNGAEVMNHGTGTMLTYVNNNGDEHGYSMVW